MIRKNAFTELYTAKPKLDFPWVVDVEATNVCNLKCQMCSRQIMQRPQGYMSEKTFKKILKDIGSRYCGIRFIRWGEPFLNNNIVKFVKLAKEKGYPVHITNNGQIIKREQMEELVTMGLDSVIFSMQGATKEAYEKMRVNASYDKLEASVTTLNEIRGDNEKPFIQITSTMTNDSGDDIKSFKDKWSKLADNVVIGKTHFSRLKKEVPVYRECLEVLKKLSVNWNGDVTACCGDFDNMLVLGNIHKESLEEIWKGEKINAIRTMLANGMHKSLTLCSTCNHAYSEI